MASLSHSGSSLAAAVAATSNSAKLGRPFSDAPQLFRTGFRERAECGLATPCTLDDRLRNALANVVVFAARDFSTNSIERDIHICQRAWLKAAFNHRIFPIGFDDERNYLASDEPCPGKTSTCGLRATHFGVPQLEPVF